MVGAYECRVAYCRLIAEFTAELALESPAGFSFVPGQYIKLMLPTASAEPQESYRELSLSNRPGDTLLTTAFRVSGSRFKQALLGLRPGDRINIKGPLGVFTLPEQPDSPIFMIAGGIGITPFMSMLRADTYRQYDIRLSYYNDSVSRAAYRQELETLSLQPRREVKLLYRPETPATYRPSGETGLYFVAGSPGMVSATVLALTASGIMESAIRTESFTGYKI